MSENLEKISSDLKGLDQALTQKMTKFSEAGKNDAAKIRSDMAALKTAMIDKKVVDSALKDQQEIYQLALRKLASNFEDKIADLEKKLKALEKVPPSSKKTTPAPPAKAVSSTKVEPEKTPPPVPPKKTATPDSGSITEEDLHPKTPG